jgi:hypothetical protein
MQYVTDDFVFSTRMPSKRHEQLNIYVSYLFSLGLFAGRNLIQNYEYTL